MAGRHRMPSSRHHRGRHRQPPPPTRWIAPTLATVAVLAAGGVSAYSALTGGGDGRSDHRPVAASPVARPTASTAPSASATTAPTVSPSPSGRAGKGSAPEAMRKHAPALRLAAVGGVSWVEVTRPGGHVAFSGMLRHGHALVYRRGPVAVTVGNAGAVRVTRHGHGGGRLGRPGQVVRFTVH